jgi:hypothetical protein
VRWSGATGSGRAAGRRRRNRGGGIGRWEEGERGGADRWGRAASERKERARAEGKLGQGTAHAGERRERVRWASGEKGEREGSPREKESGLAWPMREEGGEGRAGPG